MPLIHMKINKLNVSIVTPATSILKNPNVAKHLSYLHDKYIVVPAEKVPNNICFLCVNYKYI